MHCLSVVMMVMEVVDERKRQLAGLSVLDDVESRKGGGRT